MGMRCWGGTYCAGEGRVVDILLMVVVSMLAFARNEQSNCVRSNNSKQQASKQKRKRETSAPMTKQRCRKETRPPKRKKADSISQAKQSKETKHEALVAEVAKIQTKSKPITTTASLANGHHHSKLNRSSNHLAPATQPVMRALRT